jgi:hypothetical protein
MTIRELLAGSRVATAPESRKACKGAVITGRSVASPSRPRYPIPPSPQVTRVLAEPVCGGLLVATALSGYLLHRKFDFTSP